MRKRKARKTVKNKNELPATKKKKISKRQALQIPKSGVHNGISYDSLLELGFIKWLEYLKDEGYVKSIERAETFELTPKASHTYIDSRGKSRSQLLLRGAVYTPEFRVVWTNKYADFVSLLYENKKIDRPLIGYVNQQDEVITIIEIKPVYDRNNSIRVVKDRIKFLYAHSGIFVNLVQPELFYEKTFCIEDYLTTSTGNPRRLSFVPKTLPEYLKTLK